MPVTVVNPESLLYVYAFCPVPSQPLTLPAGIAAPTVWIAEGTLGAIAEPHLDMAALKDNDQQLMTAILTHDRVLGDIFAQVPILPLRFGTQFTGEAALRDYLQKHQAPYQARLQALQDKAEYLIKLTPRPLAQPTLPEPLKGRDYFLAKKRLVQAQATLQMQQQEQLQQFLQHLTDTHPAVLQDTPQDGQERLHVLAQRHPTELTAAIAQGQTLAPDWEIQCSEPLPPYHFAS